MRRTISWVDGTCKRLCATVAVDLDRRSGCDWGGSLSATVAGLSVLVAPAAAVLEELVVGALELCDERCGREEVEDERRCCDIVVEDEEGRGLPLWQPASVCWLALHDRHIHF